MDFPQLPDFPSEVTFFRVLAGGKSGSCFLRFSSTSSYQKGGPEYCFCSQCSQRCQRMRSNPRRRIGWYRVETEPWTVYRQDHSAFPQAHIQHPQGSHPKEESHWKRQRDTAFRKPSLNESGFANALLSKRR